MEKNIVEYFEKVLSLKRGHLSINSLSGHLAELSQKERKYIKKIGGLEKLLVRFPEHFLMMDEEVYIIQKRARKENGPAENTAITPEDKKSTVNLESAKDDPCTVCSDSIEIYAVGECRHPICYRCCTKLRVLCEDKSCPVCRKTLDEVVFSKKLLPVDEHDLSKFIKDKKNGIWFENLQLCEQKSALLRHHCPKCPSTHFETFSSLEAHARDKHQLFYCEICVRQCKIFTDERKVYSKDELKKHTEEGDATGSATGGHPLCEFCRQRYLDNDELLRHLHLHHCSCVICDQANEGDKSYRFYADKNSLLDHQRENHFPCEHPDCIDLVRIPVFKDEIDLQSHNLQYHSEQKSKMEKRAEQRINVPLNYERKKANAKKILQAEPDAVGGINITGCIARRIEKLYSFIERDDAPGQFVENVFFDLEACGLEPYRDLRETFQTGDRVAAYALPCTNPHAKSNWKAQKVEKLDDEDDGDVEQQQYYEPFSDYEVDTSSPPPDGSLNEFPSLASRGFRVQSPTPALGGWSKLAQAHSAAPRSTGFMAKKTIAASKPNYAIGYVHQNLVEKYGFIQADKNHEIFENNVYFNLESFQRGMATHIPDLRSVLTPGDKVCYTLQEGPAYCNVKSKYRAKVVWKYTDNNGGIFRDYDDNKTTQVFAKAPSIDKIPVSSDMEKTLAEKFKKKIQSGVTSSADPVAVSGQSNSAVVVIEDLLRQPAVKKKADPTSALNEISTRQPPMPDGGLTGYRMYSQLAQVVNFSNYGLSQEEFKQDTSECSPPVYGSSDEDESSDEENDDGDIEVITHPNQKIFMEVIAACLNNKAIYKIFRDQMSTEMGKQGVSDQTYLQFVELRKEDNSAHILFRTQNSSIGHTGYAKLTGFYPLDASWMKMKQLVTKITKELFKINGSSHYVTVVRNKSEKVSRITLHYDRPSDAKH